MPPTPDSAPSEVTIHSTHPRKEKGKLLQVLGVGFGIAVAVGNSISVGIVRTPGSIAALLPNAWLFFAVWIGGALYALVSAFQLSELGTMIPKSGGQYNFSRRALGDYAGFIVGWSDWISTCGTTGAVGIVFGAYLAKLFPIFDGDVQVNGAFREFVRNLYPTFDAIPMVKITGVSVIVIFALLQWKSVSMGSKVQNFTTLMKGLVFFIMVIACFSMGGPAHAVAVTAAPIVIPAGAALITALLLGMQATIYTFDGWDGVIYFGDEIKNPGYLVPRAIFASLFSLVVIYMLINAAVIYVLPMGRDRRERFLSRARRGTGVWPLRGFCFPLHHGHRAIQLDQCPAPDGRAGDLRHEPRHFVFLAGFPCQQRRHADAGTAAERACGGGVRHRQV